MNLLNELTTILSPILPIELGVFTSTAPNEYIVITPLSDIFELHCDNAPTLDTQEARISIFTMGNYIKIKNKIVGALLDSDFYISARVYVGHEDDTGYYNYAIDVAKTYIFKEE